MPDTWQSSVILVHGVVFLSESLVMQMIYESLPEGTVQFGHALSSFSQDEAGVQLSFEGLPDVRAKFLVAADGYLSPTRETLLADGPPPFAVRHLCFLPHAHDFQGEHKGLPTWLKTP